MEPCYRQASKDGSEFSHKDELGVIHHTRTLKEGDYIVRQEDY